MRPDDLIKDDLSRLSDSELQAEVVRLTRSERATIATLIAHLAELDARRLYLGAGCRSLFAYCVEVLRLSEHEAYNRIEATRVVRRFPRVLAMIDDGSLNLTTVRLLSPHMTPENGNELLAEAAGKGKREVEVLLACRFPKPDVPDSVRRIPVRSATPMQPDAPTSAVEPLKEPQTAAAQSGPMDTLAALAITSTQGRMAAGTTAVEPRRLEAPSVQRVALPFSGRRPTLRPLAAYRYEVRFTASSATCEKLELAKDLLRHSVPNGDTAAIVDRALTVLLEDLARKKYAATNRPRAVGKPVKEASRHIPADVKRTVWIRDVGRCRFTAKDGRRCSARGFLEFHHVRPYAVGGAPTLENIELRCSAHNAYEADLYYGPGVRMDGGDIGAREPRGQLVPERVAGSDPHDRELRAEDLESMEESAAPEAAAEDIGRRQAAPSGEPRARFGGPSV